MVLGGEATLIQAMLYLFWNALRYGKLGIAPTIGGPSPVHAQAKPFANLGEPLAVRQFATSIFTAFFDDVSLSHSQILQLLRGAIYISIDGGAIVGQISPPR